VSDNENLPTTRGAAPAGQSEDCASAHPDTRPSRAVNRLVSEVGW